MVFGVGVKSRAVAVAAIGAMLVGAIAPMAHADELPARLYVEQDAKASGTTYYVSTSGKDTNSGTSEDSPWTLEKVNETTFKPGDRILFKAGETWQATGDAKLDYDDPTALLHPLGSGNADAKIALGSYGSENGSRPVLKGNAKVNDVVQLKDQEYWDISGLDVSNEAAGFTGNDEGGKIDANNGALVDDLRGIHIYGQDAAKLSGFDLHDLYVHDVTGEVAWITQSQIAKDFDKAKADMAKSSNGVLMAGGWDFSKRTGGILMETFKPSGEPTVFSDVLVEKNDFKRNSFGAFTIKQWYGGKNKYAAWDGRASNGYQSKARMHTNVVVRDNNIDQKGVYNGDGVYLTSVRGGRVENNVIAHPGVCGIELYFADDVIVEGNEVYDSQKKAGGSDSNGIDPDRNVTNTIIQRNYIHNSGEGILLCGYDYNTVIIRYNVIADSGWATFHGYVWGGHFEIYNNVIYQSSRSWNGPWVNSSNSGNDTWHLTNNIFYYNRGDGTRAPGGYQTDKKITYDHNVYVNAAKNAKDANAITIENENPFEGVLKTGNEEVGLDEVAVLKPVDARLNDIGVAYTLDTKTFTFNYLKADDVTARDFAGNAVSSTPDPGIYEVSFTGVGGTLTDAYAATVAGATVTFKDAQSGKTYAATTGASGRYQIADIPAGDYGVTVTGADGKTLLDTKATVNAEYTVVDLRAVSDTGTLAGTVKDLEGNPVKDAQIAVTVGGRKFDATTDGQGRYTVKDVPVTTETATAAVTAAKDGYRTASAQDDVTVKAGAVTQVDFTLPAISTLELDAKNADISNDGLTKRDVTDGSFSGGSWAAFENGKNGSYAEYTFKVPQKDVYDLTVFTKDKNNRATVQLSIDGVNTGEPMVMSGSNSDTRKSYGFEDVKLGSGEHTIRFTITDTAKGSLFGLDALTYAVQSPKPAIAVVDKTDLAGNLAEADKLDEKAYTAVSWEQFAEARQNARAVLDDAFATTDEVTKAIERLNDAKGKLVAADSDGGSDNGGSDNNNGGSDNGGSDNNNGGSDNNNGGSNNGGSDNGGSDNGGSDNGGSDNNGSNNGDGQNDAGDKAHGDKPQTGTLSRTGAGVTSVAVAVALLAIASGIVFAVRRKA
ncbi:carboxypeptidase regulatory-like domain-containing protein [Bifidobacterium jacchi]|nr:carboxypeptidase regulatory-like domain-containing protein [Bifidobacterium jacchi]